MCVLSHGFLLSSYKVFSHFHTWLFLSCVLSSSGYWLQMSLHSLCLLSVRSLVLQILPCITWYFHLLHVGSCRSIWKILRTSLQVSILHPRHHSSWAGILLPFLLGYFIAGRLYINDVAQQCHITALCLRPLKVSSYYSSFWIISWTVVSCNSEQVSSFFSCRWLYTIFPTSQMH